MSVRVCAAAAETPDLGAVLLREGDMHGAALEFRRAALSASRAETRGAWYGAAGYAYLRGGQNKASEQMLDAMEDATPDFALEAMILRGENARLRADWPNAAFYFGSARRIAKQAGRSDLAVHSGRHAAAAFLRNGNPESAAAAAGILPEEYAAESLAVLTEYGSVRDKSPRLGGLLGMIPGMGYLYSGEIANAARSLILNGLFIFAMADTAAKDQWGAFAAATFFEITWYSGSIYGGVDAAHRHNRNRLNEAARRIEGDGRTRLNLNNLPLLSLRIEF